MNKQTTTVFISKKEHERLQKLIDQNRMDPKNDRDGICQTMTAQFDNGIEADIKICNSENGPWIDPVLFFNGSEIGVLEPQYTIEGEYLFEIDENEFIVKVEVQ